jgi:hypothetical protein
MQSGGDRQKENCTKEDMKETRVEPQKCSREKAKLGASGDGEGGQGVSPDQRKGIVPGTAHGFKT